VSTAGGRSFDSLTPRGRTGRLRALARVALEQYDGFGDARVSLLRRSFNTLFRVVDSAGHKAALRVGARERIHTAETERVETAWLTALAADTDIATALPIANRWGGHVTHATHAGVPGARTCMLFEWAPGRRLSETMTVAYARSLGRLLAQLHEHGAQFEGGRPQPVVVGDRALGFVLADRIPRHDPVYGTMLADALDRAQRAIDALWASPPHPPHILHGDLHPNNVLAWRGRLTPIDFQDALWGFEIQDVSTTVTALESHYPEPRALVAALRAGYADVRQWPADDTAMLGELVAARHLSVLNLGYNLRRPGFERFVAGHGDWLRAWMR
jgi:Ser/Thr protein kinase RdoA (MazF antagonist)